MYLWLKALHLIFMVTWFAGLFYLPRLYVYHAMCEDEISDERFKIMERKLYRGIMTPGMILTLLAGIGMLAALGVEWVLANPWIQIKLALVAGLVVYHFYLGALRRRFAANNNQHGHVFYRWINEAPVLALFAIVLLAVLRPSSG